MGDVWDQQLTLPCYILGLLFISHETSLTVGNRDWRGLPRVNAYFCVFFLVFFLSTIMVNHHFGILADDFPLPGMTPQVPC